MGTRNQEEKKYHGMEILKMVLTDELEKIVIKYVVTVHRGVG